MNSKVYQDTLLKCKNVLNLKWESSSVIDVLAVQFGLHLKAVASTVLEQYRVLYVDKLETIRQAHVDLTSPVYQAAAFYVGAKSKKVNLDKNKIAQMAEVDVSFFRTVIDSMTKVTADTSLSTQQEGAKPSLKTSKKRAAGENSRDSYTNNSSSSAASYSVAGYPEQSQRRDGACMSVSNSVGISINGIEYNSSIPTAQPHKTNICSNDLTDNSSGSSSSSSSSSTYSHSATSSSRSNSGSSRHEAPSRENVHTNVGCDRTNPIPVRENNTLLSINPKGWLT